MMMMYHVCGVIIYEQYISQQIHCFIKELSIWSLITILLERVTHKMLEV
jgi:hypothetical protein